MKMRIGLIDYDFDRYGRRIRKYVLKEIVKVHGRAQPVWEAVDFTPDVKIPQNKFHSTNKL